MERILLCKPKMCGRELEFIKAALAEDWAVPLGPDCDAFEHELEAFVGRNKKIATLVSGTAAVHLALIACGVGPGDEVLVQSFTFCASSHPVTYLGATPVFVDSEKDSWNIDLDLLEEAIKDRIAKTGRTPKAIIPVALYGMPYQIDRIMEIADRYGIPVVEDAAEGFGSRYRGQVLGTFGRYGVLSFNGNKMITTSGGGALICPDADAAREILWYATQARESYPYYQHEAIGYNYRMSNICAGIGRGQMTVADEHIAHHRHVQALYEELLKGVDGITMHSNPGPEYDSNYWLCTATLDEKLKIKNEGLAYRQVVETHAPSTGLSQQPSLCQRRQRGPLRHRHLPARRSLGHRRTRPLHSRQYQSGNEIIMSLRGCVVLTQPLFLRSVPVCSDCCVYNTV